MANANENGRNTSSEAFWKGKYILAPFVPTPYDVVDRMLALAEVTPADTVYDLGCGDGRIVIRAAKMCGARGVGIDMEPYRVTESQSNAKLAGVEERVTIRLEDALEVDLSRATVVMLYLIQWSTLKMLPVITRSAKPGTRVVSHNFDMGDWAPNPVETFRDSNGDEHRLYLWTVR